MSTAVGVTPPTVKSLATNVESSTGSSKTTVTVSILPFVFVSSVVMPAVFVTATTVSHLKVIDLERDGIGITGKISDRDVAVCVHRIGKWPCKGNGILCHLAPRSGSMRHKHP